MPQDPTERQQRASRRNGAQSKGPVTDEGKARSSKNGLKHGLRSGTIVLANESKALYDELLAAYRDEWAGSNLAVEVTNARWRLRRIQTMETAAVNADIALSGKNFLDRLDGYEQWHTRAFLRAVKKLVGFQRLRGKPKPPDAHQLAGDVL